jgi:hypothetical protein
MAVFLMKMKAFELSDKRAEERPPIRIDGLVKE